MIAPPTHLLPPKPPLHCLSTPNTSPSLCLPYRILHLQWVPTIPPPPVHSVNCVYCTVARMCTSIVHLGVPLRYTLTNTLRPSPAPYFCFTPSHNLFLGTPISMLRLSTVPVVPLQYTPCDTPTVHPLPFLYSIPPVVPLQYNPCGTPTVHPL